MNKTISRRDILTAIRNEPLKRGSWVYMYGRNDFSEGDKRCEVCAVGAILRQGGFSNYEIDYFGGALLNSGPISPDSSEFNESSLTNGLKQLIKEKKYIHALSVKFEDQASRTGAGKITRKVLSLFVKKNFPKRIRLNPEF